MTPLMVAIRIIIVIIIIIAVVCSSISIVSTINKIMNTWFHFPLKPPNEHEEEYCY